VGQGLIGVGKGAILLRMVTFSSFLWMNSCVVFGIAINPRLEESRGCAASGVCGALGFRVIQQ
jgi:hypothetical protein